MHYPSCCGFTSSQNLSFSPWKENARESASYPQRMLNCLSVWSAKPCQTWIFVDYGRTYFTLLFFVAESPTVLVNHHQVFSFDLDMISISCVARMSPVAKFSSSVWASKAFHHWLEVIEAAAILWWHVQIWQSNMVQTHETRGLEVEDPNLAMAIDYFHLNQSKP